MIFFPQFAAILLFQRTQVKSLKQRCTDPRKSTNEFTEIISRLRIIFNKSLLLFIRMAGGSNIE
jgi:hypothetical protein